MYGSFGGRRSNPGIPHLRSCHASHALPKAKVSSLTITQSLDGTEPSEYSSEMRVMRKAIDEMNANNSTNMPESKEKQAHYSLAHS